MQMNVMLYIENPKDITKKLLKLISEFSNVAGDNEFNKAAG